MRNDRLVIATALMVAGAAPAPAQAIGRYSLPWRAVSWTESAAGSPAEYTALIMGLVERTDLKPSISSIRPLHAHASLIMATDSTAQEVGSDHLSWESGRASFWTNTGTSRPDHDGPIWQGRGITA